MIRKAVDLLGWMSVVATIIALMLTLFTTYSVGGIYIKYFSHYYVVQWCIFFTMLLWAVKLYFMDTGKRKFIYPGVCLIFAICSFLFIMYFIRYAL